MNIYHLSNKDLTKSKKSHTEVKEVKKAFRKSFCPKEKNGKNHIDVLEKINEKGKERKKREKGERKKEKKGKREREREREKEEKHKS